MVSAPKPDKPPGKPGNGDDPLPPIPATYFGGSDHEAGNPWGSIAVDSDGNVYITGQTQSPDLPTTPGAFDTTPDPADAFIAKFDPTLTTLLYSTYLSGDGWGNTFGKSIAVDADGYIYVTGFTADDNFPTTSGAYDTTYNGHWDAFIVKLNPAGNGESDLVYSTFLGGLGYDSGEQIAFDTSGNIYVGGWTDSEGFPTTVDAYDPTFNGVHLNDRNGFIAKLNPAGGGESDLVYSTFLGMDTAVLGLEVDSSGNTYVTGITSGDFPTTPGAYDTTHGGSDVFLTKLNPAGSALVYSTYIGGGQGLSIDVDELGNAYVTGKTSSGQFPTTDGAFDIRRSGREAFVTKVNAAGSDLVYSTFLGGKGDDEARGIAVDSEGNAHIAGSTWSRDFPTTPDAFDRSCNGGKDQSSNGDAFFTILNPTGSALVYSTYIGGTAGDQAHFIAVDTANSAYITGHTVADDFPANEDCYDHTYNGGLDNWVAKLP
jgi:hypothetical protein